MADKPTLSLEVQAKVESEHERVYEQYKPVSLPEVDRKNPVLKTATVKLDLTRLSKELFRAVADKYLALPYQETRLRIWFNALSKQIEREVLEHRNKDPRYAIHCPLREQRATIRQALKDVTEYYMLSARADQYHRDLVAQGEELAKKENVSKSAAGEAGLTAREAFVVPRLKKKGMSKSKWAAKAGVDPAVVYDYLADRSNPRPDSRLVLAEALGVDESELPI